METKSCIVEGKINRYFDKNGVELFDGDDVMLNGEIQRLYLTEDGNLGTDAKNPALIASGLAVVGEYGIYPLEYTDITDMENIEKI